MYWWIAKSSRSKMSDGEKEEEGDDRRGVWQRRKEMRRSLAGRVGG